MITEKFFGKAATGEEVFEYVMTNKNGMQVNLISYAGIIKDIIVPYGKTAGTPLPDGRINVLMGYETLAEYEADHESYYGAFVGRYANRIVDAQFTLNGVTYKLPQTEPGYHLHGEICFRVHKMHIEGETVVMDVFSPDGDEGFPGNMNIKVVYSLTDDNALKIEYTATCDKDCPINLTSHPYFNLNGRGNGDISHTLIEIPADHFTRPLYPTGNILDVTGTRFDYRKSREMGTELVDENFCVSESRDMKLMLSATGEKTGLTLKCCSTQIGVQLYNGRGDCIAVEPQHYPCSVNYPHYPSTTLKAGDVYNETILYKIEF